MDIFGVLSFVGGLAMFLYGMSAMGDGLTKLSGGKLEYLLEKQIAVEAPVQTEERTDGGMPEG